MRRFRFMCPRCSYLEVLPRPDRPPIIRHRQKRYGTGECPICRITFVYPKLGPIPKEFNGRDGTVIIGAVDEIIYVNKKQVKKPSKKKIKKPVGDATAGADKAYHLWAMPTQALIALCSGSASSAHRGLDMLALEIVHDRATFARRLASLVHNVDIMLTLIVAREEEAAKAKDGSKP